VRSVVLGDGVGDLTGIVAGVGPDDLQPWKSLANLVVAILEACGVDDHAQPSPSTSKIPPFEKRRLKRFFKRHFLMRRVTDM
jgi:hypothetical protein